jgi:hypothetical protein
MTGLSDEQLTDLVARVHGLCGEKFVSAGRPLALGLVPSVVMVVCLIRKNVTQDFAGAVFGVSQATVSLWVPRTRSPHATCRYSWTRPPSRSRRRTRTAVPEPGGVQPAGGR